jgi:hypothetical protein
MNISNRVLRSIFWSRRVKLRGSGEEYMMGSYIIFTSNKIFLG